MRALLVLAAVLTVCHGQCRSKQESQQVFGQYLNCIKGRLDSDYQGFETEYQQDNQRATGACFAASIGEANAQARCVMTVQDLNMEAWSREGPLRDCSICRTFANAAIKAILKTTEAEQRCIRAAITKAVSREADHCLSRKLGSSFAGIPEIPDLEAGSFNIKQLVIKSISDFILIRSRLAFCETRKPDRARNTEACLNNPFQGFMTRHCQAIQNCDRSVPHGCQQVFSQTRVGTCECIDEARGELKQRIGSIAQVIKDTIDNHANSPGIGSSSTADRCVMNIKAQLITTANDWLEVIGRAMSTCLHNPPNKSLSMEAMLRVGCRKVISETKSRGTADSHRQLKVGFDFINNLIDAFVDRSKRFCGGPHCG